MWKRWRQETTQKPTRMKERLSKKQGERLVVEGWMFSNAVLFWFLRELR